MTRPAHPRRWQLAAVAAAVLLLDQGTKLWAVARLTRALEVPDPNSLSQTLRAFYALLGLDRERGRPNLLREPVEVVPGLWAHRYVENPGGAWGLLAGLDERVRVPFFHAATLLAIALLGHFHGKLQPDQRALALALALVLGGALGNYLDRLTRGYVIDFVDWHWPGDPRWRWPTFNLADAAISLGVLGMLADALLGRRLVPEDLPGVQGAGRIGEGGVFEAPGGRAAPAAPPPGEGSRLRDDEIAAAKPEGPRRS